MRARPGDALIVLPSPSPVERPTDHCYHARSAVASGAAGGMSPVLRGEYGEHASFHVVIEEHQVVPFRTTVLGNEVTATKIGLLSGSGLSRSVPAGSTGRPPSLAPSRRLGVGSSRRLGRSRSHAGGKTPGCTSSVSGKARHSPSLGGEPRHLDR